MGAPKKSRRQKRLERERRERHKASEEARQPQVLIVHVPSSAPSESWWKKWSKGEVFTALGVIVGIVTLVVMVSQGNTSAQPPKQEAPVVPAPKAPEGNPQKHRGPHIQYVPLPHGDPFRKPGTLVTSLPEQGEETRTISINGEKVPVMTENDLENVLAQKTPESQFVKTSNDIDLWISVGKDGRVEQVQGLPNDGTVSDELKSSVKQWKFKPFVRDGENVAVQTVIQLKGSNSEKR